MSLLSIEGLTVRYASGRSALTVLDGLTLTVERGRFVSLIGPSGCGKTTLLHTLAGQVRQSAGRITMPAVSAAMVFQRPTLLPWQTVLDNALFGIACQRRPTSEDRAAARQMLEEMGLAEHLNAHPHALSEGMSQRVNLARALLTGPDLLLLDEPFSALDVQTRRRLQDDLLARWAETDLTALLVSHALEEVAYLSDEVHILTDRPARVFATVPIALPRPRGRGAAGRLALAECTEHLASLLAQASPESVST